MTHRNPMHRAVPAVLILSLLLLLCPAPAPVQAAATNYFVVPLPKGLLPACTQLDPCLLQTAVDQAADGDTIYVAGGTYTATADQVLNLEKSVLIQGGWSGNSYGRVIINPAVYPTILDGEDTRGVVYITNSSSPTLRGLIIQNGKRITSSGGGILIFNNAAGDVTIENCIIRENDADHYGGGIALRSGTLTLQNSQVYNNTAVNSGAALILYQGSSALLENSLFYNNYTANFGSLVHADRAHLTLRRNRIRDHTAGTSLVSIANFSGSETKFVTLENNIITQTKGNILYQSGDGLVDLSINHNTFAGVSQGIYLFNLTASGSITNNIFTDIQGSSITLPAGSSVTVDHNLFWQNGWDPNVGTQAIEADPLLTADYHLIGASPAIDAGADSSVTIDFDGDPRPSLLAPDIGADEFYLPLFLPFIIR